MSGEHEERQLQEQDPGSGLELPVRGRRDDRPRVEREVDEPDVRERPRQHAPQLQLFYDEADVEAPGGDADAQGEAEDVGDGEGRGEGEGDGGEGGEAGRGRGGEGGEAGRERRGGRSVGRHCDCFQIYFFFFAPSFFV